VLAKRFLRALHGEAVGLDARVGKSIAMASAYDFGARESERTPRARVLVARDAWLVKALRAVRGRSFSHARFTVSASR